MQDGGEFGSHYSFSRTIPSTRIVPPSEFKDYRVHVDLFRASSSRSILGEFKEEYVEVLTPDSAAASDVERRELARKRFAVLVTKEFVVLTIDAKPAKAYVVSAALERMVELPVKGSDGQPLIDPVTQKPLMKREFKTTPTGNYRLDPLLQHRVITVDGGTKRKELVAYPWMRSRTYDDAQMYWGLWIKGGYFIHSTPHYGQLGQRASMGCVRQSFPDAMELFDLIVNQKMTAMIRIHPLGSQSAIERLQALLNDSKDPERDMKWVVARLYENWKQIRASVKYYGPELPLLGHGWIHPELKRPQPPQWPLCGPIDCFTPWKMSESRAFAYRSE